MEYRLSQLPGGGVAATDATVREIARLCQYDLQHSTALRFSATSILRDGKVPGKDTVGEARAIFEWIRRNVRYQKDPVDIETVQSPIVTLRLRAGDCDDHSALMAALAMAVGLPARFHCLGYSVDRWVHIVSEVYAAGRWWWCDTTERGPFGVRPKLFPVERVYTFKGEVVTMQGNAQVLPVTQGQVRSMVTKAVWATLTKNWKAGLIDEADLRGYLDVIAQGNFFTQKPILKDPTRAAIEKFIAWAPANLGPAKKYGSGLSGMSGFLSSIASAVGGVVKQVVGTVVPGANQLVTAAKNVTHEPRLSDLELAVNSPDGRMSQDWMSSQQIGLTEILSYMRKWGLGWLPITSANSFLSPPTLPMYLHVPTGQLSMVGDIGGNPTLVPFSGKPQDETSGMQAINEIVKQFGAASPLLSKGEFYKLRGASSGGGGAITQTIQAGLSSPVVLIGLGLAVAYLLFGRSGRRAYA